ncbi:MAG: family 78 glycoside hydrolase catalytic domain [Kiritimatiellia bacterium]
MRAKSLSVFCLFLAGTAQASFISVPGGRNAAFETACFVRTVTNRAAVVRAVWRTTGLGVYEAFVNGARSGTDVLKPGFTSRTKCRQVTTEDVTALVKREAGAVNVLSAWVTSGWWRDAIMATQDRTSAFWGELELAFADGSSATVVTDAAWRAAYAGPVTEASIYTGEDYDARADVAWMTTGAVSWPAAVTNGEFRGELRPMGKARVVAREDLALAPQRAYVWLGTQHEATDRFGAVFVRRECADGEAVWLKGSPAMRETLVVDFGQNHAGVPEFEFEAERGVTLTCLPGEMLNDGEGIRSRGNDGPGGSVYRANVCRQGGGRIAEIRYRFAGGGVETYRPRFSFFGYRYLQLSATGPVKIRRVRSIPLSSIAQADETLTIETGNPAVNRLVRNARWGMLSNYLSVPTDCPQRNERLGWTADTQVFSGAGAYLADTCGFLRKWMRDVADSQRKDGAIPSVAPEGMGGGSTGRVGWGDAAVIVPYRMWRHFGRTAIVEESWPMMERYLQWVSAREYRTFENEGQFADWLSFEDYMTIDLPADWMNQPEIKANVFAYWNYLGGCYWLWDARMMREMAAAIGKDAAKYAAEETRALAYLRGNFLADGDLLPFMRKMQTPQLFAMKLGLFADAAKRRNCRDRLLRNFADNGNRLKTGFLGTSILLETLSEEMDAPEMAYSLLLQRDFPGWLYSVDQGATTIWERWNSYTREQGFGPVGMNSFNHYAYGAVVEWIASTVAGFRRDPERPGKFLVKPVKDRRLGWVKATYRTPSGEVLVSEWREPAR